MNNQERISNPSASSTQQGNGTGAEPDKSYFSPPPAVSLPKGGGAIKGMGEKFAANPVTGTGSMSVPIATTPGRSGFGPQLTLSYDSGAGNGMFGLGWNLSLPSITRKTDKGLPRYFDAEESDVFVLSGAEDLVPIYRQDTDGTWVKEHPGYQRDPDGFWVRDANGHLVIHEDKLDSYLVRRYRPRIEGLFARIERWTKVDSGETHWRSISKDNITTLYGKTAESRIANPNHATRIFSWLICESYDDKGNAIVYQYKSEDAEHSVGIDLSQAHEQNRTPQSRATNRYLKRIQYGNQTPRQANEELRLRQDWMFEVVFDYGEHDLTNPISKEPEQWTTETLRHDPFSSYRAGFEVRTYRLCQRVLMFHHIPDLTDGTKGYDGLVRSTDFTYSYEQNPVYSFLKTVTQTGYKRNAEGGYIQKSLPPLEFTYSEPNIDETVREVDRTSLENLPQGLDGTRYQWVDLDGEGLSGILTEQGNGWFYKRNLSPINTKRNFSPINTVQNNGKEHIEAKFAPVELVVSKPASGLANGAQFLDLAGDGQPDLVILRSANPGFYERTQDAGWENFIPFKSLPILDWDNPNLKFIDLDGDGHTDILITEDDCFVWHPSLAEDGFGVAERVHQPWDEEKGPRIVFADGTQSIYLADMSGDGLTDIVRIRNGEVCYWANLGYGRFGTKVTMDNAPWFDAPNIFNQRRILLVDIDGSGTTDILYLSGEGVQVYFNQSGNSWSAKRVLKSFPAIDSVSSVTAIDLLGNGTACLVWSSPLLGNAGRSMRYIELMGGEQRIERLDGTDLQLRSQKPHLLIRTINNLGAETIIQYAASTKFYLQDWLAEKPWITKLPFPVHVVERVETRDYISGNRFVTRYAYHHGYFDGEEREFRGFGFVKQWDTEDYGVFQQGGGTNALEKALHVPPVLTKTWFHTGVYVDRDHISNFFAEKEYYREPQYRIPNDATEAERQSRKAGFQTTLLPDTILPLGLTVQEEREAVRSLKGRILRQEIYALDDSGKQEHPYSVSERNYEIRLIQRLQTNRHAVFYAHDRETIDYHYERCTFDPTDPEPDPKKKRKIFDPRVTHAMTLEVDEFGNGVKSVAIAYGRRKMVRLIDDGQGDITEVSNPELNKLAPNDQEKQTRPLITYTENRVTNKPNGDFNKPNWYRIGVPIETRTYEITGLEVTGLPSFVPFTLDFIHNKLKDIETRLRVPNSVPKPEIAYEEAPDGSLQRRLIERVRTRYRKDSEANTTDPTPLPLGEIDSLALPCESFKLAFTPGLLTQVYSSKIAAGELNTLLSNEGKYRQQDDVDGWWIPSGRQQFDPTRFCLVTATKDPFGHKYTVTYDDYKLLIIQTQDSLENIVQIRNDYRVMQPWEMTDPNLNRSQVAFDALGMVVGSAVMGKATGIEEGDKLNGFIADLTDDQIKAFFEAVDPRSLAIQYLGTATTRIIYDFERSPVYAAAIARKQHVSDLQGQPLPLDRVQVSFVYSDGFGREAQTKVQAEPGPLDLNDPNSPILDPRWVGTGTKVFNNKGKPVRQYEPFFSPDHTFGIEQHGVSSTLFYDPVERVVATLHPNHTYEKLVFDPWQQMTWDVNDIVLTVDPKADQDVGSYFERLPERNYLPTWYDLRTDPIKAIQEWPDVDRQGAHPENAKIRAAEKAAAEKAAKHVGTPTIAHFDTLGRPFLTFAHNRFERNGIITEETYSTRVVLDIEGNQREVIDARGNRVMRYDYDLLGHVIHSHSMDAGERWTLNNVAGNPIRGWDSRGFTREFTYDQLQRPLGLFVVEGQTRKLVESTTYGEALGNAQNHRGRVYQVFDQAGVVTNEVYDFKGNLLSSKRQLLEDYRRTVNWLENPVRERQAFTSRTTYDALNRPVTLTTPDNSVTRPTYNEANLLEQMRVNLQGSGNATLFVKDMDYNAKGQRTLIEYGEVDGNTGMVKTEYQYDEKTFRLTNLKTTRSSDGAVLQNLSYTYDPVGNITEIRDDSQQTIFHNGERVEPISQYIYDALYRLIQATGREHIGQTANNQPSDRSDLKPHYDFNDSIRRNLSHPNDLQGMRNYTEQYKYDEVGNILKLFHQANGGTWTRHYDYAADSNRLRTTNIPNDGNDNQLDIKNIATRYRYDEHGSMIEMPHLSLMQWDFKDQLQASSQQVRNDGIPEITYYVYDASGQRVRKVTERQAVPGEQPKRKSERIYLGSFEIYREYNGDGTTVTLERQTLHVVDDERRIALVETKTKGNDATPLLVPVIRYQLDNHLGSACIELDKDGKVISYEEYYPYGNTSYQGVNGVAEVSRKRYRYTGKERDEETGLYYHGARHYVPWLGRWASCDPQQLGDGINFYSYVHDSPTGSIDLNGMETEKPKAQVGDVNLHGTQGSRGGVDPTTGKAPLESEHLDPIAVQREALRNPKTGKSPIPAGRRSRIDRRSPTVILDKKLADAKTTLDKPVIKAAKAGSPTVANQTGAEAGLERLNVASKKTGIPVPPGAKVAVIGQTDALHADPDVRSFSRKPINNPLTNASETEIHASVENAVNKGEARAGDLTNISTPQSPKNSVFKGNFKNVPNVSQGASSPTETPPPPAATEPVPRQEAGAVARRGQAGFATLGSKITVILWGITIYSAWESYKYGTRPNTPAPVGNGMIGGSEGEGILNAIGTLAGGAPVGTLLRQAGEFGGTGSDPKKVWNAIKSGSSPTSIGMGIYFRAFR